MLCSFRFLPWKKTYGEFIHKELYNKLKKLIKRDDITIIINKKDSYSIQLLIRFENNSDELCEVYEDIHELYDEETKKYLNKIQIKGANGELGEGWQDIKYDDIHKILHVNEITGFVFDT